MQVKDNVLPNTIVTTVKNIKRKKQESVKYFIVEGIKLCEELLTSCYKIAYVIIEENNSNKRLAELLIKLSVKSIKTYQTKKSIFENIAETVEPQGILAVVEKIEYNINILSPDQSFIILDNVADPGNVGTIIRTAEWFGINQILLYGNCASQYNSKVIRSTMGSFFRIQIIESKNFEDIFHLTSRFMNKNYQNINIYGADINAKTNLIDISHDDTAFGLVVGNESRGISEEINSIITCKFAIKGQNQVESLNVGIALGISLFHISQYKTRN